MGSISDLSTGRIEEGEGFYLMAKIRSDQSASLLNSVSSTTGYDTAYFVCMNKINNQNKNLFYLSCDPEDYMVNRTDISRSNGAVEFFHTTVDGSVFGTQRVSYKNNLTHNTGYLGANSLSSLDDIYSTPPGVEISLVPSSEYNIPIENHSGPAYNLTMAGNQINFYFRKNTSQSGTKLTFEPLVNLTSASPKFISLNRSYVQLTASDYTATDDGFTINTVVNANKVNMYASGILMDSANNYFNYTIMAASKNVHIIGTAQYNSASIGDAIVKTGNIYFIKSSDFTNSFSTLETLVGSGYNSRTQYLDFFMIKRNSYGSGGNPHVSHGLNTSSSDDRFYSSVTGELYNPHSYGILFHFLIAYIDPDRTTVSNYSSQVTDTRNNAPTQPHVVYTTLHDSMLGMNTGYARTDDHGTSNLSVREYSGQQGQIAYNSVESYSNDGTVFKFDPSEYQYNQTIDYVVLGIFIVFGVILLTVILIQLLKLNEKDEVDYAQKKSTLTT